MSERSEHPEEPEAMRCRRCRSAQPQSAHYCHRCGQDHLAAADGGRLERAHEYVVRPGERVRSFHVVTSLLPLSSGRGVRTYQIALLVAVAIPLAAAAAGWVAFAVVAAAAAVPTVFTIYLYDVNEWDDQPLPVVLATLLLSAAAGALLSWLIDAVLLDVSDRAGLGQFTADSPAIDTRQLVVVGIVAPLVALVVSLAGPLWLASRPRFDDLIDGLTFGAVSGAAYAAGETLVFHRAVFTSDALQHADAVLWLSIVANAAFVKPIVYGSAVAIAAAAFSGIGPGYAGFTARFAKGLAIAAVGMIGYGAGVSLLGNVDGWIGAALGLAWGVIVAAALVIALRTQLHLGVLEASLEAAQGRPSRHEVVDGARCAECDMPLAPLALFCNACGTSVRTTSKSRQRVNVGRVSSPLGAKP
jgi:hypothetical protein